MSKTPETIPKITYPNIDTKASRPAHQKAGLFLCLPGSTIIAQAFQAVLIRTEPGRLCLLDLLERQCIQLEPPSYAAGIELMQVRPTTIGLIYDVTHTSVGFWLGEGREFIGMFEDCPISQYPCTARTRLLATPSTLRIRPNSTQPWETLLWHIQQQTQQPVTTKPHHTHDSSHIE